ncbi:MAG: J domain-containing protein [Candidatus Rokubacteria bacterium]|nr:J domain-containing protein [Candidatus Rokubacteria bacterium]
MRRDYYAVLGVSISAGPREIRQAYRRLARQYSPDVNFWDHDARTLFQEIEEAYRVLSDPMRRAAYDRYGGSVALGHGRRGEDVHVAVELSFADAARGATLAMDVPRDSPCRACGAVAFTDGDPCRHCGGRGVRRAADAVSVTIPPGVDSGAQIRVAGEGDAGPFGGPRGDLIVSTRVAEHPFFRRQGDAVQCEVPISVWEALTGARIRIPTPTGDTVLVIPPGLRDGIVVRLRGQGMPRLSGQGRGDLHVTLRIEVPGEIDARTHELVRELERLLPLAPRADLDRYCGGVA